MEIAEPITESEISRYGRIPSLFLHPAWGLFLASFIALFLKLLLIRWVPSIVRVVGYYGNLMLLSSFLGLGCGVLLSHRRLELQKWFAPLLFLFVLCLLGLRGMKF